MFIQDRGVERQRAAGDGTSDVSGVKRLHLELYDLSLAITGWLST